MFCNVLRNPYYLRSYSFLSRCHYATLSFLCRSCTFMLVEIIPLHYVPKKIHPNHFNYYWTLLFTLSFPKNPNDCRVLWLVTPGRQILAYFCVFHVSWALEHVPTKHFPESSCTKVSNISTLCYVP